jgi:hypothetical protein
MRDPARRRDTTPKLLRRGQSRSSRRQVDASTKRPATGSRARRTGYPVRTTTRGTRTYGRKSVDNQSSFPKTVQVYHDTVQVCSPVIVLHVTDAQGRDMQRRPTPIVWWHIVGEACREACVINSQRRTTCPSPHIHKHPHTHTRMHTSKIQNAHPDRPAPRQSPLRPLPGRSLSEGRGHRSGSLSRSHTNTHAQPTDALPAFSLTPSVAYVTTPLWAPTRATQTHPTQGRTRGQARSQQPSPKGRGGRGCGVRRVA